MPRNMSFMLTTQQVVKAQGLKKGEQVVKIHLIEVVSTRWEPLNKMVYDPVYGYHECILEGFPDLTPDEFVAMFCEHNKCKPDEPINRIEFKYLS